MTRARGDAPGYSHVARFVGVEGFWAVRIVSRASGLGTSLAGDVYQGRRIVGPAAPVGEAAFMCVGPSSVFGARELLGLNRIWGRGSTDER